LWGYDFLAKHGFLNNIKHTGDELEYFGEMLENEECYKGQEHFSVKQVFNDGGACRSPLLVRLYTKTKYRPL